MSKLLTTPFGKSLIIVIVFILLIFVFTIIHKAFIILIGDEYSISTGFGLCIGWLAGFVVMMIYIHSD